MFIVLMSYNTINKQVTVLSVRKVQDVVLLCSSVRLTNQKHAGFAMLDFDWLALTAGRSKEGVALIPITE